MFPTAYKSVPFELVELKASDDDAWTFSGLASTFGNLDHTNDVVMRGAFDETLASGRKRRLLWMHDVAEPLGREVSLKVTDEGLFGTWKISKTARGIDARELLLDKAIDSLSIGYVPTEYEFDDAGTRLLKAVDLLEVSLVSIPANDLAVVTQVKHLLGLSDTDASKRLIVNLDAPFDAQLASIVEALDHGAREAEALWQRRAAEGREPSEKAIGAAAGLRQAVEAASARLAALLAQKSEAEADDAGDDPGSADETTDATSAASADLSLRLALVRHRLRAAGLLERAS